MNSKKVISLLVIFIVILALLFLASKFIKKSETSEEINNDQQEEVITQTLPIKHQYKNGEHVFVGTIETPTPCHSFNAEIVERENQNPLISISINDPSEDQICAQVITERTFKVVYPGPEDLNFDAELNGQKIMLNIFEISPDEDIDTFELFIKG